MIRHRFRLAERRGANVKIGSDQRGACVTDEGSRCQIGGIDYLDRIARHLGAGGERQRVQHARGIHHEGSPVWDIERRRLADARQLGRARAGDLRFAERCCPHDLSVSGIQRRHIAVLQRHDDQVENTGRRAYLAHQAGLIFGRLADLSLPMQRHARHVGGRQYSFRRVIIIPLCVEAECRPVDGGLRDRRSAKTDRQDGGRHRALHQFVVCARPDCRHEKHPSDNVALMAQKMNSRALGQRSRNSVRSSPPGQCGGRKRPRQRFPTVGNSPRRDSNARPDRGRYQKWLQPLAPKAIAVPSAAMPRTSGRPVTKRPMRLMGMPACRMTDARRVSLLGGTARSNS